jgi:hypothetical protein
LFGPSTVNPPAAPTKPNLDADIIFDKWAATYPVNIPKGFLHFGNTAGATAMRLKSLTINPGYNLDIGTGSPTVENPATGNCYFGFFAKNITIKSNNENSSEYPRRFLDLYDGAGLLGATSNAVIYMAANGINEIYLNGHINNITNQGGVLPLRSTIYFNGATSNGSGGTMSAVVFDGPLDSTLINIWNTNSHEIFNFSNEVTFTEGAYLDFNGQNNIVNIEAGAQWGEVSIIMEPLGSAANTSRLNLLTNGNDQTCNDGPETCFTPSTFKTIKLNSNSLQLNPDYPFLTAYHGCFIKNFRLEKGRVDIETKADQAFYVRGGYINPKYSKITDIDASLQIQDSASFSSGFVLKGLSADNSTNIYSPLNYNVRMFPTDPGYSFGTE